MKRGDERAEARRRVLAQRGRLVEAAALEQRADMIMRTAAITQCEAQRLYARAAVLRERGEHD